MVSDYISKKAPLFYYSFRQVRQTNSGVSEIHAANKITIRKHSDFNKDGLEFLVYNCALSATPELCGGVRYTSIERDSSQRVDFYGKGFSGNGVPLNTWMGVFLLKYDMATLALGRTNEKNILFYYNFYEQYGEDTFQNSPEGVIEFIRSSGDLLDGQMYDPLGNVWHSIRAVVLDYYSVHYGLAYRDFMGLSRSEWENREKVSIAIDKVSLLRQIEALCDEKFYDSYQEYRRGNEYRCTQKMENMVSLLGTYYLLYRTVL